MAPLSRGIRSLISHSLQYRSRTHMRKLSSGKLQISQEVSEALNNGSPLVSLESTIITHGMPFPTNLAMARDVESIIRAGGAIPATVAIIDGKIHVGLTDSQLEELAEMKKPAIKTSRRDFPYVVANKLNGGTTVSGTMVVSHMAGIDVFVTGGIGGVHRGGEVSMDVSADLTELGRTPVCVVCAGVKSILDIGLTLEYLETQGVCVASFGESKAFPAFYTPDSGFSAPYCVGDYYSAAGLIRASGDLGLAGGVLIGVPIPMSEAAGGEKIEGAIRTALDEARERGIAGRDVTPYILGRLNQLTSGESLRANLSLVKNNAKVGSGIAVELAAMKGGSFVPPLKANETTGPLVVGGSIFDFVVRLTEGQINLNGGTHGGTLQSSHGGVGRNVACALARLGQGPRLISAVGGDREGRDIVKEGGEAGIDTQMMIVEDNGSTATYTAVLDSEGDCKFGVGDMGVHASVTPAYLKKMEENVISSSLVICDGNLSQMTVHALLEICKNNNIPFFFEPTDIRKAVKPLISPNHSAMTFCSPNLNELNSMLSTLPSAPSLIKPISPSTAKEQVQDVASAATSLLSHYKLGVVLVTLSDSGVVLVRRGSHTSPLPTRNNMMYGPGVSAVWYPCTSPCTSIVSVSGAGDCLTAGFIAGMLQGLGQAEAVSAGMQAAKISCGVSAAVPDILQSGSIDWGHKADGQVLLAVE